MMKNTNKLKNGMIKRVAADIAVGLVIKGSEDIIETAVGAVRNMMHEYHMTVSIGSRIFPNFIEEVRKLDPEKFDKHRLPSTYGRFGLNTNSCYFVRLDKFDFVQISTGRHQRTGDEVVALRYFGPNRKALRDSFYDVIHKRTSGIEDNKPHTDHLDISMMHDNGIVTVNRIQPRDLSTVILPYEQMSRIVTRIQSWLNAEKWYNENGLPYKLGLLFHGKPGTGKSSLIRAIATQLNGAKVMFINMNKFDESLIELINYRNEVPGYFIVVLEDLNASLYTALPTDSEIVKDRKESTKNMLLNLLDGLYSTNRTLYIATTNSIESIDDALIRPGRFDVVEEFMYFDKEHAGKIVESFGFEPSVLDELDLTYPVMPAEVVEKLISRKADVGIAGGGH